MDDVDPEPKDETRVKPVEGVVCGLGRAIISSYYSCRCTYRYVISSSIMKGAVMVMSNCSLVLEMEMTISFNSLNHKLCFSLFLSMKVKGFLTTNDYICMDALILHVII